MSDSEELEMSLPESEVEPEAEQPEPVEVSSEEPERVLKEEEATPPVKVKRRKKRSKKSSATKASASQSRLVRSIYSGVVVISHGMPSKATYRWSAPGSVVSVAAADVGAVMKKNGSGARECCGSSSTPVYFEFAD